MTLSFRQHVGEFFPGRLTGMLAAELALAIAPAAGRDRGGDTLVDADAVDRDRGSEARADRPMRSPSTFGFLASSVSASLP